jgi:leukotriene-A4 hydrolase
MSKMEEVYHLNSNNNSEIKFRWIRLGLKAQWEDAIPRAVQMVTEQGRMKFLRPIYRFVWISGF